MNTNVEVLISESQIQSRVAELGAAITRDFEGLNLLLVGVLKGSFIFLSDLCRKIELPLIIDFIGLSSYRDRTVPGPIRITSDLTQSIAGMDILVVEDIIDTGSSMHYLLRELNNRHPRSIKVCALLQKPSKSAVKVPIDYLGFTVPNVFVVGYGLDYQGQYRNLRQIGVITSTEGGQHG